MEHAKRFRALLAELGLSNPEAAKTLRVSLRTLQNWLSGRHEVPYAAYKLLRLIRHLELPGEAWRGWSFARGVLITPEGRTISPNEGSWWSMLVRRSSAFQAMYDTLARFTMAQADAKEAALEAARTARSTAAKPPNLLLGHFRTRGSAIKPDVAGVEVVQAGKAVRQEVRHVS